VASDGTMIIRNFVKIYHLDPKLKVGRTGTVRRSYKPAFFLSFFLALRKESTLIMVPHTDTVRL
jgi:hypothetical protein